MNQYRITKYNPKNRNSQGHYFYPNEWTEFSDVGKSVSLEEYELIEDSYISSAIDIVSSSGSKGLVVRGLEKSQNNCAYSEGEFITINELSLVIQSILRGNFWCKLESDQAFIHIGYDFYMYVGSISICNNSIERTEAKGLYVETFESPYN